MEIKKDSEAFMEAQAAGLGADLWRAIEETRTNARACGEFYVDRGPWVVRYEDIIEATRGIVGFMNDRGLSLPDEDVPGSIMEMLKSVFDDARQEW